MKRVVIVVAVIVGAVVAISQLSDLTQSRPDSVRSDAVTEIVVAVNEDRFAPGQDAAADALWAVCAAQTSSRVTVGDGLQPLGGDRYRVVLRPALGRHSELKLVGCLEDLTIDRVLADVKTVRSYKLAGVTGLGLE
jgi:hypothetical protein